MVARFSRRTNHQKRIGNLRRAAAVAVVVCIACAFLLHKRLASSTAFFAPLPAPHPAPLPSVPPRDESKDDDASFTQGQDLDTDVADLPSLPNLPPLPGDESKDDDVVEIQAQDLETDVAAKETIPPVLVPPVPEADDSVGRQARDLSTNKTTPKFGEGQYDVSIRHFRHSVDITFSETLNRKVRRRIASAVDQILQKEVRKKTKKVPKPPAMSKLQGLLQKRLKRNPSFIFEYANSSEGLVVAQLAFNTWMCEQIGLPTNSQESERTFHSTPQEDKKKARAHIAAQVLEALAAK